MIFRRDKSAEISLPKARKVHGVTVRKVPVGRYIELMKQYENLPAELLQSCFPDISPDQLLSRLANADKDLLLDLAGRVLAHVPEKAIGIFCGLLELEADEVMQRYTPAELLDIFLAFWELNDLSGFFGNVWGLMKKRLPTQTTGSKSGLPSPKA